MSAYLRNVNVSRSEIANDIKVGVLTKSEILDLVQDEKVRSAFIGDVYNKKIGKRHWNKKYLDQLTCAAVAESFNEDYLLYLYDVAEYVRKKKKKAIITYGIIGFILLIVAVAVVLKLDK